MNNKGYIKNMLRILTRDKLAATKFLKKVKKVLRIKEDF